ncbi:MAG: chromosomal replication initiator protein DnaA [Planctomycetota bacterium]
MGHVIASVWETALDHIKEAIGPQKFQLWFQCSKLIEVDDQRAVIGVPNLLTRDWLERRFTRIVTESLAAAVGRELTVEFKIDAQLYRDRQSEIASATDAKTCAAPVQPEEARARYALANFVVGPCNELAYRAACRVVEDVGTFYNPLFIHGGSGLGKTHLLQGIAHALRGRRRLKTLPVSAVDFTSQFVQSARNGDFTSFRSRFRSADVLLVDEMDFLANKEGTQEEFLHTFDALLHAGRQIIIASSVHPRELSNFNRHLVGRLIMGLVVRLDPPDMETRVRILQAKAAERELSLPAPVAQYVAANLSGNVRELEGALNCVTNLRDEKGSLEDLAAVRQVVSHLVVATAAEPLTLRRIEGAVREYFGIEAEKLHSRQRSRAVAYPRQICMYLARELAGTAFQEIAGFFGSANHTTAISACNTIRSRSERDPETRKHLMLLRARLKQTRYS